MVILHTSRLTLRPLKLSDVDDLYNNVKSKEVLKFMRNLAYPYKKELALPFIRKTIRELKAKKAYDFAICLSGKDRLIGFISLFNIDYKNSSAEIGYWLGKRHWNKGYITEAVEEVVRFGFKTIKLHRICAKLSEENAASRRVLEKMKFKCEGVHRDARFKDNQWHNELTYALLFMEME